MTTIPAALAVGFAPTLAIITTYLLARRDSSRAAKTVARKVEKVASAADVVAVKVDDVAHVAAETAKHTGEKLEEIHVLVNSRLTEALTRIDELEKSLKLPPGAPVPRDP
jgi:methyl-accepting chemotaxis protein